MPSIIPEAPPQPKVGIVRPPLDDEFYVMERYAAHASHCAPCAQPYATLRKGESLCPRGAHHVKNMAQYIYSYDGKAYSVVSKRAGEIQEIAIPSSLGVVSALMRAFDYGLKIKKARAQVVIHNPKDAAQDAPATPAKPQPSTTPIAPALTKPEDSFETSNTQLIRPSSRGTLFASDVSIRNPQKYHSGSRIKRPGEFLR